MKIFLCLFLISGINYVSCFSSILFQDLKDIAALIPTQEIFDIFDSNKFDPVSHKASDYVSSKSFHGSMYLLFKHPNMKLIKQYLEINGIDVNELLLQIVLYTESEPKKPKKSKRKSLKSFIESAYSVSQLDNIVALVIHKTAISPPFRTLYSLINILDYNTVYFDMKDIQMYKDMVDSLNQVGINTEEVWRAMGYLFGWQETNQMITIEEYEVEEENQEGTESALFHILRQYINLIPKEKFIFLYRGLLVNPLFQEITTYIFNKGYYNVTEKFNKNPIIGSFFSYLRGKGVDFNQLLDLMRDRLGFTFAFYKIPNGKYEENSHSFSLIQFFELAKKILPINDIKKLTDENMMNSEYRDFTEKITDLVYNYNLELYFENQREIRTTAMQYGFDIYKMLNFFFMVIGFDYKIPSKGNEFTKSIYEFIELFPKYDYLQLYDKYKNDMNIWKMVSYLKGPKFADFVQAFFSTNELRILTNFLNKHSIPFKAILVDLFDRVGIMQWWINYEYFCGRGDNNKCLSPIDPNSDNVCNFVKERHNLLPLKEILMLFHSKLQSNDYFQNLYLLISGIDGPNLMKKITEHDVLRDFFIKFVELGYNFRAMAKQFGQLFGWGNMLTVDLSLNQTMENFENLLYRKELFKILNKYPDEVQQLREFFKNPSFTNTLNIFANTPVVRNIISWMEDLKVPVVNLLNNYLAQDTPNEFHLKLDKQLKWEKMMADIALFLKKNKFFEFSVSQKYNSIEFHALMRKLLAVNINVLSVLYEHPEGHYVSDKLTATGINFLQIFDFIYDMEHDLFELHKL